MYSAIVSVFLMSLSGSPAVNTDICGVHIDNASKFIETLLEAPGTKVIASTETLLSIADQPHLYVWSFARLANAHPVVICREVVKAGDHFRDDTHIVCDGKPAECLPFLQQFRS
jgi:hypothetical protein